MRDRTVNRVESWDARPFSGGFATLRDMSDAGFSGVVVSGDAWLFMLNGRVVGIVDGDIDDFEDATGTMYDAPDPSLPLLFSMQERGGTTQAKYYTNDTPLEEADRTLSDANFTGYVELSENVLSGDYYLVYYGGRALPVAFVGTTEELKTGDDAYDLAADEVGVYEVIKTPVNVTQIPAAEDDEETGVSAGGATAGGAAGVASEAGAEDATPVEDAADDVDAPAEEDTEEDVASASDEPDAAPTDESPVESAEPDATTTPAAESPVEAAESDTDPEPVDTADSATTSSDESRSDEPAAHPSPADEAASDASANGGAAADTTSGQAEDEANVFSEEEQWRQTKSIPSLSPSEREKRRKQRESRTASSTDQRAESSTSSETSRSAARSESTSPDRSEPAPSASSESASAGADERASTPNAAESAASTPTEGRGASPSEDSQRAEERVRALRTRIEELEGELESVDAERDDMASDLAAVREERDDLKQRVSQLESALEEAGGEPTSGPALTPDEALADTNLFVRYGSKGQPTLDELTGKNPDQDAINTNLRIDHHTQFDSGDASVDGTPFQRFLEDSSSFRFVSWLVRELPYEILDSGRRSGLGDLYDIISEIDRAELQGTIDVESDSGTERREFDVVLRDRMGNPLVVAELNDARDPVTGDEMAELVDAATVVGDGADTLGAAFYVTASFFEPAALENASEATANGGILSRSDRLSYVKLARKSGFHLCLAEDRNETFHLTVPEL